jgi:tRNA pseudouridine38-40 synthase
MNKYVFLIEYDGTEYFGWQKQAAGTLTVQSELERAIEKVFEYPMKTIASGRTDRGVHAAHQVVQATSERKTVVLPETLMKMMNTELRRDVRVKLIKKVNQSFHARYWARKRAYTYNLITDWDVFRQRFASYIPYKLDFDLMDEASNIFLGEHDFTTFSKLNKETQNHVCDVETSQWQKISDTHFAFHIKADRFVYSMVRSVVGAMIDIGRGKRTIEQTIEAFESQDRSRNSPIAPPFGLSLVGVWYPEDYEFLNPKNI